jgi:CRP-like cAMP-binding protein
MNAPSIPAATSEFLDSLIPTDRNSIEPHLRDVQLRLGSVLCAAGEPIDFVYFPTCGMVSIVTTLAEGQEIETGIVGRRGVVGSATGTAKSFHQCMVQIAGEGRRLPRDNFLSAYDYSKSFRNAVNVHNMGMWAVAQQCAACNAGHQLEPRMARWLLETRDLIHSDEVPLPQEFVAMMLGVQRTSVTLAERNLQAAGLIQIRRGRVVILDGAGLRAKACDCYDANKGHRNLPIALH